MKTNLKVHDSEIQSLPMLVPAKLAIDFLGISKATFYRMVAREDANFPKPKKTINSRNYWLRRDLLVWLEEVSE